MLTRWTAQLDHEARRLLAGLERWWQPAAEEKQATGEAEWLGWDGWVRPDRGDSGR